MRRRSAPSTMMKDEDAPLDVDMLGLESVVPRNWREKEDNGHDRDWRKQKEKKESLRVFDRS